MPRHGFRSDSPAPVTRERSSSEVTDSTYEERLRATVKTSLAAGIRHFPALCRKCEGAFPSVVLEAVKAIGAEESLVRPLWLDDEPDMIDGEVAGLPEPHPADYEWRFTNATANSIALWLNKPDKNFACFGAPSVFLHLRRLGARSSLFDNNPILPRHLPARDRAQVFTANLAAPLGEMSNLIAAERFDAVVLDPPWYLDHTLRWLDNALQVVKVGGVLMLTLFPELVRPRAREEREKILSALKLIGSVRILPSFAWYATPTFEQETLAALGLPGLLRWRGGQLVVVQLQGEIRLLGSPDIHESIWDRVQIGQQIIAVRHDSRANSTITIEPPNPDGSYLLRSVSARDPTRNRINLWTSRNRALIVSGSARILEFLRMIESGMAPASAVELTAASEMEAAALQTIFALAG
jgi:hypothetical protein